MSFALFLFICTISLSIESANSLALPASIKHSPLGAFTGRSTHVTFPEMAFYSVSTTAILFCIVGAFILKIVGAARVLSIMESFPRGATFRNAIRRLPTPFAMDGPSAGQIAPRRPPIRTGGASPPVAGIPRGRRYRRQTRNGHIV